MFEGFEVEAATKRDRFDEALDALLAAWSGDEISLAGAHFAARAGARLRLGLRPLQRPHPPLVVAAFGPKGLLQAARRGLPYLASPLETLATLEENYALWREHRTGPAAAPPAGAGDAHRLRGSRRQPRPSACARRSPARPARSRASAPPALARAAGGALEERVLVGTAHEVRDGIARYRERLGMDLLVARIEVGGASPAARDASLERLAGLTGG